MPVSKDYQLPPSLKDKRVLVWGPGSLEYKMMFRAVGMSGTSDLPKADIVCFTGGEDVDPSLYGEDRLPVTGSNLARDQVDAEMFRAATAKGKFKVGICRGGQFLNVMSGGKMWQDVGGHGRRHNVLDKATNLKHMCTSTHHQMIRPTDEAELLGVAFEANYKKSPYKSWVRSIATLDTPDYEDAEVVLYPATKSLCFQPHPEFITAPEACTEYFFNTLGQCFPKG